MTELCVCGPHFVEICIKFRECLWYGTVIVIPYTYNAQTIIFYGVILNDFP